MRRTLSDPALYLSSALGVLPLILAAVYYDELPLLLAVHWNASGQPDQYCPTFFAAVVTPLVLLALSLLVVLAVDNDPTRRQGLLTHCCKFAIPAASVFVHIIWVLRTLEEITFLSCIQILAGMILVAVGAYLPSCQQSQGIGVLLPWTMRSVRNWNMTHRAACVSTAVAGAMLIAAAFIWTLPLIFAAVAVCLLVPVCFSFGYAKRHHET